MRISLKPSTVNRLSQLETDYATDDLNELIQNALTELTTLRRLAGGQGAILPANSVQSQSPCQHSTDIREFSALLED